MPQKYTNLVFFNDARIALDREIKHHPELVAHLNNHLAEEFELRLLEIATYCEVVLNGDYTQQDLDEVCDILHKRLVFKRTKLMFPRDINMPENPHNRRH